MKFCILLGILITGSYVIASNTESATTTENDFALHIEDTKCTSIYVNRLNKIEQYSSIKSKARCEIKGSKMMCSFHESESGKPQGKEWFKITQKSSDSMEALSMQTKTAMNLSLVNETYTYHFTGFRSYKNKLITQICTGKIH